jgi:putative SOS response-associated peptidase YedK
MCGRFSRTSPRDVIVHEFGVTSVAADDLAPRYNVCPGDAVAAIVATSEGRRLGAIRWGLGSRGQINVRSETVARHPVYREAFADRRCLVVADGFYEWRRDAAGRKTPHYFRLASGQPFAFAAIWSRADAPVASPATAILTCPPNEMVAAVHDRMPVIVTGEACDRWLTDADTTLFRPFPADAMESYPVSPLVNSAENDSPECIRPAGGALRLVSRPAVYRD